EGRSTMPTDIGMSFCHLKTDKVSFAAAHAAPHLHRQRSTPGVTPMSAVARLAVTNSQPLAVRPWVGARHGRLVRRAPTRREWRRRSRERRMLAALNERELADFGASSADVYRELATPFWRAQPPC